MNTDQLVRLAFEARRMSYSPYSHFAVGAALLAKNGKVFLGCNIENVAYSPTNCAERTAFFKAVSEGITEFTAIAICGGNDSKSEDALDYCTPCGVCRQVMMEFCDPETFKVILAKNTENYKTYSLKELLPMGFGPADM